jgi:hypothetical protein
MYLGVITKSFLNIEPREHQEAYQQSITRYSYSDIALAIHEIKDLEEALRQALRDARFITSLYEHDRDRETIQAHTWACMPIPTQVDEHEGEEPLHLAEAIVSTSQNEKELC